MLCLGTAMLLLGTAAVTGSSRPLKEMQAEVAAISVPLSDPAVTPQAAPAESLRQAPSDEAIRAEDLQAKLRSAERRHTALARQIKSLEATRASLKTRMEGYRHGTIARLSAQLREAEALHNIYKARLAQSNDALDRQQQLRTKGYASQANFDAATALAAVARNDVAASAARVDRIRVELDSAKKGIFIGDGRDDVPYSQQRDDEIMLRLVDLTAQAQSTLMAINDLAQQVAKAGIRPTTVAIGERTPTLASIETIITWDSARNAERSPRKPEPPFHQPD